MGVSVISLFAVSKTAQLTPPSFLPIRLEADKHSRTGRDVSSIDAPEAHPGRGERWVVFSCSLKGTTNVLHSLLLCHLLRVDTGK